MKIKLRGADYVVKILELLEVDSLFAYPVEDESDIDDIDLPMCNFRKERCEFLYQVSVIFWDEFIEQYYLFIKPERPDKIGVFNGILIKFSSNDQFVSAFFDARISHGFQQQIQSLVMPDEAKKQKQSTLMNYAQFRSGFYPLNRISKMIKQWMMKQLNWFMKDLSKKILKSLLPMIYLMSMGTINYCWRFFRSCLRTQPSL